MQPLKIYLKPHLKKFVLRHHPGKEPLFVDERTMLGDAIIRALLETRKKKYDRIVNHQTDFVMVVPTTHMSERSPRQYKLVRVSLEIEKDFRTAVVIWVSAQVDAGLPAKEACKALMQFYNIEEQDMTLDGIYKIWQRFNEEQQTIKKLRTKRTP